MAAAPFLPLLLMLCGALHAAEHRAGLRCGQEPHPFPIETGSELLLQIDRDAGDARTAVLMIEELGRDLEWRFAGEVAYRSIDARPPRLGIAALTLSANADIQVRPATPYGRSAAAMVTLHCAADADILALARCLNTLTQPVYAPSPAGPTQRICAAWRTHAQASRLSQAERPVESADMYSVAAQQWQSVADTARQSAAMLGVAEQRIRAGQFEQAAGAAVQARELARSARQDYFAARAEAERCMALHSLDRGADAQGCYDALPAIYATAGELNDAANAYANAASFALERGDYARGRRYLERAATIEPQSVSAFVTGNLQLAQGKLAALDGRILDGARHYQKALSAYEAARRPRWQANTLLRIAELYHMLGAHAEATLFVDDAFRRLPEDEAPSRVATALRLRGRLRAAAGNLSGAMEDVERAGALFRRLGMGLAAYESQLDTVDMRLHDGEILPLPAHPSGVTLTPRLTQRTAFVRARQALHNGEVELAQQVIAGERAPGTFDDLFSLTRTRAAIEARGRHPAAALGTLDQAMLHLADAASRSGAAPLRHITGLRLLGLRQDWLTYYMALPMLQRPGEEALWTMLIRSHPSRLLAPSAAMPVLDAESFDRQLSAELLRPADLPPPASHRSLWSLYAGAATASAPPHAPKPPTLAGVRAQLPADDEFLILAFSATHLLNVAVRTDGIEVLSAGTVREFEAASKDFLRAVADPNTAPMQLALATDALSRALFAPRDRPPPQHLRLMVDEGLAGIPYSALLWPGQAQPLVETTAVTIVQPTQPATAQPAPGPVFILASTADGGARAELPALPAAVMESRRVEAALPGRAVSALRDAQFDRTALQLALATPGAWVHIAAHGTVRPGLQGYAGLWLTPRAGDADAELVSWLDLADRPIAAELVVLNACQLGGNGAQAGRFGGAANFASALSAGGATHVIAALWPVSDAATSTWVPALYTALDAATPVNPAQALRSAQRAMRQNRLFRHPYYWASLVHVGHFR
ncbi:CHAT domain-containing protein [Tahibacter amnicola]|uniref:CHAT domain-containing protein n=1 Tax=Tahibacter amnicola TaxID=2976241 RepID=A0ABY6BIJ4_9GAMM|nr:CHAT domain-containing protein [Tahibacter amnicola]UXI69833.1 CHAT domain-containing protein [Tahibacter amnicola]